MSTQAYSIGDTVELSFTVGSTQTTAPEAAVPHLVVTDPTNGDTHYTSTQFSHQTPSSDSTQTGWSRWLLGVVPAVAGRWKYQWTSTGAIHASAGGAFAVRGVLASTST